MKAGRELDALVAEKVMGWIKTDESKYDEEGIEMTVMESPQGAMAQAFGWGFECDFDDFGPSLPRFSSDVSAAWEVIEHFSETHRGSVVRWFGKNGERYAASFWPLMETDVVPRDHIPAETAPLAICLAALKAVGVEVEA